MNCTICHKPIILNPSASERARRYGGKASDYTRLFTEHAECTIARRNAQTSAFLSGRMIQGAVHDAIARGATIITEQR